MSDLRFKPEDFLCLCSSNSEHQDHAGTVHGEHCFAKYAAKSANARLEEMLAEAPEVFFHQSYESRQNFKEGDMSFSDSKRPTERLNWHTHRARLVRIEKMEK